MPWRVHLAELRRRIIVSFVVILAMTLVAFLLTPTLFRLLKPEGLDFHAFAPTDTLTAVLKLAFGFGLFLSLPFLLYQIWAFVRPGLTEQEARAALRLIPLSFLFFVLGLIFAYAVVFPALLHWMTKLNAFLGLKLVLGVQAYLTLLMHVLLPVAFLFELPLILFFFAAIGLLTPERLRTMRPYAYFALIVGSWLFVPGDWVTLFLLIGPLLLLYELSALFIRIAFRRRRAMMAEADDPDGGPRA